MGNFNAAAHAALRKAAEDAKRDAALSKTNFECHTNSPHARPHERQVAMLMRRVHADNEDIRLQKRALK